MNAETFITYDEVDTMTKCPQLVESIYKDKDV